MRPWGSVRPSRGFAIKLLKLSACATACAGAVRAAAGEQLVAEHGLPRLVGRAL